MDDHKVQSGVGKAFGLHGGENIELYRDVIERLITQKEIAISGVENNPYEWLTTQTRILGLFNNGESINTAGVDSPVEVIVAKTGFYIESGGQVGDTGWIVSADGKWEIEINEVKKMAAGVIVHIGTVTRGTVNLRDDALVTVDRERRMDTMRNHTATHLLHGELHKIIGEHARQAGSLVAPDRLRFDFTHHEAIPAEKLEQIEAGVNQLILDELPLSIKVKPLQEAMAEGAMALFGEKYGENVRTVTVNAQKPVSYELCGGTHVENTGQIGTFLILSEGSTAAGVRRIEAVTGREAYNVMRSRTRNLKKSAKLLSTSMDEIPEKIISLLDDLDDSKHELDRVHQDLVRSEFLKLFVTIKDVKGTPVLIGMLKGAENDTLRSMTDLFREKYPSGIVGLGSIINEKPSIICMVSDDLVKKGINAGEIVRQAALAMGGSGGGRPNLGQAGGKEPKKLSNALDQMFLVIESKL
jgi:alanyl-tRNA synthetase